MVGSAGAEGAAVRGGGPGVGEEPARAVGDKSQSYRLRLVLGLGLAALWTFVALPQVVGSWLEAVRTPAADGLPAGALRELMNSAADECPAEPRLLLLSDEPIAWMQGSYLIYPQRIDVIQTVDGFTSADLDAHAGGCLMWYRSSAPRIQPFVARLAPIRCLDEGCLYRLR